MDAGDVLAISVAASFVVYMVMDIWEDWFK